MRGVTLATAAVSVPCILLSCTSGGEVSNKASNGPAHIVVVAPFSGPLSEFGWSMLRGARMRIKAGEDRALPHGRAVKVIALDDRAGAQQAVRLAKNMASHRSIVGVIGHLTTSCTLSAAPEYHAARLIHISPVAPGDALEGIKSPYTFRTILSEGQQVRSLADYLYRTMASKKVAVIYEDSPLGTGMKDSFVSRSRALGLSVRSMGVEPNPFPGLDEAIGKIVSIGADAVFLAGGPRLGGTVVRKWPERAQRPPIFGTYRLVSEEFTELAGERGRGVLAAHPCVWRSDFERGRDVRNLYEREFKQSMDWLAIQTYDAVDLLVWAASKSGLAPGAMRVTLLGLNSERSSVPGLAGPLYFNPDGSLARGVTVALYTGEGWRLWEDGIVGSRQ